VEDEEEGVVVAVVVAVAIVVVLDRSNPKRPDFHTMGDNLPATKNIFVVNFFYDT
jgi:hypothetical protein